MSHTFHGPLRRCPENPRYFTDDTGQARSYTGTVERVDDMEQISAIRSPYARQLLRAVMGIGAEYGASQAS